MCESGKSTTLWNHLLLASEKRISERLAQEYALGVAEAGRRLAARNQLADLLIETPEEEWASLFTEVPGIGLLGSSYPRSCIATVRCARNRPQNPLGHAPIPCTS